ncbi:MAG: hypothetical protein EYC70_08620 [Planctomycetota bacterium]|nr:MAG: hypothetical protein EYC70_08620 [Planctomycetota bacterium]
MPFSSIAIAFTAAVAAIQSPSVMRGPVTPKFAGVYRVASGELSPDSAARGPDVIFNNTVPSNYYAYTGRLQEWVDEGGLFDRQACLRDQINGFDFLYCSEYPDPTGDSGTITITFYDDNRVCGGPPSWPNANCAYVLSGLPLGSATGGQQCWWVAVDLSGGFECPATANEAFRTEGAAPHGRFGWGFLPLQDLTGPWVARGGYKVLYIFNWFDHIAGTFIGCALPQIPLSFAMRMYGPVENSMHYRSGSASWPRPLDTLELLNTTDVSNGGPPETWEVLGPLPGHSYWLLASAAPADRSVLGGQASLLVDMGSVLPGVPIRMPAGALTTALPPALPAEIYVQALETAGPPPRVTAVSNGLFHCF